MSTSLSQGRALGAGDQAAGEFRLGWKILVPSFIGFAFAMGQISTISVGSFVKPISEDLGWSRSAIQASLLFGQGFATFGVIITGMLLDRIGMRRSAIIGLIGTAVGFALIALSTNLVYFYAIFAITAVVGAGAGPITFSRAVTRSFDRSLGFALAIVLSGSGLALIILPSILTWVIAGYGWRIAYVALACFPALVALPIVLWLFRPNEVAYASPDAGSAAHLPAPDAPTLKDVLTQYRFWVLLLSVFCTYAAITSILPNFIPAVTDGGLSPESAAAAQGVFGISMTISRLTTGFLVDRFWAPAVGACVAVPAALGSLLLTTNPDFVGATIAATLIGISLGAEIDLLAFFISRYFRGPYFPRTFSYVHAGAAAAGALSPMAFARLQEITGTYELGFYIAAGFFLFGGAILLSLGRYQSDDDKMA